MKCIDLDDTGVQHKQEGWLYIGFMPFLMRKHHFIGDLGEVTPLYWLFECKAILWGKFGRRLVEFFY